MATLLHSPLPPPHKFGDLVALFDLENRQDFESEIERLIDGGRLEDAKSIIDFLDHLDVDPDLEDDDACLDVLDAGERGDPYEDGIQLLRPVYGDDQSQGPINETEVILAHGRARLQPGRSLGEVNFSKRVAELAGWL